MELYTMRWYTKCRCFLWIKVNFAKHKVIDNRLLIIPHPLTTIFCWPRESERKLLHTTTNDVAIVDQPLEGYNRW